ncbi:peptidoglycan DD-metalloendopeptidase family protein [Streptomyces sp. NPDC047097]|uniref:peptidoglycan DD-metalloendopeptidase family protein n=1 Tax=Streptomyces sp. NPDC047097 TaxID=3155260 RepID=UPI0033E67E9A
MQSTVAKLRPTVKVGLDLDTAAVKAQLDALSSSRSLKITAQLDDKAVASSLDRLTADRTVKVKVDLDEKAAQSKLDAAFGKPVTVDILPRIQDAAYRQALQQLDRLTADRTVTLRTAVDSRTSEAALRQLTADRQIKATVDLDDRNATKRFAALTKPRTTTVTAVVATAEAQASLSSLTTPLHVAVSPVMELPSAADVTDYVSQLQAAFATAAAGLRVGVPLPQEDIGSRVAAYTAAFSQPIQIPIEPRISRLGQFRVSRWRSRVGNDIKIAIKPEILQTDSLAAATELATLVQDRTASIGVAWNAASAAIVQAYLHALQDPLQVPVHPTFDASATPVIAAHLERLRETIDVTIRPILDNAALGVVVARIDAFRQPIEVTVRPVWDTTAATGIQARLQQLAAPLTATIATDLASVPFGLAAGLLDRLARRRTAQVDVQVNQTSSPLAGDRGTASALRAITPASREASGGLAGLASSSRLLTTTLLSSIPAVASLGQAIVQLGPLAATAAPALSALIGTFAAIKVGTTGIGDAVKAAFTPVPAEASRAASATRQIENAQRSLARAQQGLADARIQAGERVAQAQQRVEDAERDLAQAQRDGRYAQQDLTAARREAVRDLADMNARLGQAQLDQKAAALAVKQAEEDLARVRSDPTASQLQIQQADLARDRAIQSAEEQRRQLAQLKADTAAANQAGVEGSQRVVQARQQVAAVDERVADRQRTVAAAQADVTKAEADGRRQVADAQQAVADALRTVAEATEKQTAQTSKLDEALAKLSPNARGFVATLQEMAPAWRGMRLDVQDSLFAGLGTRLQQVGGQILPTVRTGLVGTAGALNTMARNALTAVSNLERAGTLDKVFDGVQQSLGNLSRVPGQLVTGFAQLSVAAQPAFDRMTSGFANLMDRVMAKLSDGLKSGKLTEAINTALDVAIAFGEVLGDLGGIFKAVFGAASEAGGNFFGIIGAAIAEIRRVLETPEMQAALRSIFNALSAIAALLAGTLGAALQAVLPLIAMFAPVVEQLAREFAPVLKELAATLGEALEPVVAALMPVAKEVGTILLELVQALMPLLPPLGQLIAAAITALLPFLKLFGDSLAIIVPALVSGLLPVINSLIPAVGMFGELFAQVTAMMPQLWEAIAPLLPQLGELIAALLQLTISVLTPLMPMIIFIAMAITTRLTQALEFLVPVVITVIGWITAFALTISKAVDDVVSKFEWLFDILLGHSIIPDIVLGALRWFRSLRDHMGLIFDWIYDHTVGAWADMWSDITTGARDAWGYVQRGVDNFAEGLVTAFADLKRDLGRVWAGVKNLVKEPVRFWIDTVYNAGIRSVWQATASRLGMDPLPAVPLPKGFARGGILPGWSTWRDGDDQLVPMRRGEGVYVSEVMTDPYERARLHAMNAAAIRGQNPATARMQFGFAEGGIFDGIRNIGSNVVNKVGDALKKGADVARGGLADLAATAFKPVKSGIRKALGSNTNTWRGMVGQAPLTLIDRTVDWIRGKDIVEGTGAWLKPVDAPYGTPFGKRGSMWSSGRHTGLDFPAKTGTPVRAVDDGTVRKRMVGGPYGKHLEIAHGGGLSSLYAHMSALLADASESVKRGQQIGRVGATGNVTGPHLHLEARLNGQTVDPMRYLGGDGTGGPDGGTGVARWRGVVVQALGQVGQSLTLVNTTLRRMNQESSGNPRAVNRTDINWQQGHPSVGLMQVIRPTFDQFAGKYRKTGPFLYGVSVDPMANIYASMKYALRVYGSLARAYNRPGGYSLGGIVGITRGRPTGYAKGGITVGGKRIDTGPLAAAVGGDFLKQLTGTAATIDTAMTKVANAVKEAFKGVKTTLDDKLLKQIGTQNGALKKLADQRDKIRGQIAAATEFAKDITANAANFASLTGLPSSGLPFGVEGVTAGLKVRLGQLQAFSKNIATLGKRGLAKELLRQIIASGPDQGAPYAAALVKATDAQLRELNSVQAQIAKTGVSYGQAAADAMYDAGAQSGKGYLTGLKAQEAAIVKALADLANKIQKTLRVELKISSPSRVTRLLGRFTGGGFEAGVRDSIPGAVAAARDMARLVRSTTAATVARTDIRSTTTSGDRVLNYNAAVREVPSRRSVLDALAMERHLHEPVMSGV